MTDRNFKQEIYYSYYEDMEDGRTTETIDYAALIGIIAELCSRIEQLESDIETLRWDNIRELESEIETLNYKLENNE
jgi:hypothetical protein